MVQNILAVKCTEQLVAILEFAIVAFHQIRMNHRLDWSTALRLGITQILELRIDFHFNRCSFLQFTAVPFLGQFQIALHQALRFLENRGIQRSMLLRANLDAHIRLCHRSKIRRSGAFFGLVINPSILEFLRQHRRGAHRKRVARRKNQAIAHV